MTLTAATYIYCLDAYALALFLAVLAAYLFRRENRLLAITGIIPLIFSLGIYQPYFTVTASLCLLDLFRRTASGEKILKIITNGVRCLILLAASFLCYYILWMRTCKIFHVTPQRLDEALLNNLDNQDKSLLSRLPELIFNTNQDYFDFLSRIKISQGALLPTIHIILFILIIFLLIRLLFNPDLPIVNKISLIILLALMPTAFHSAYLLFSGGFNDLTAFAGELIYLIPLLNFNLNLNPEKQIINQDINQDIKQDINLINKPAPVSLRAVRAFVILLLSLVIWQHVIFANQAYMKKALEKNATLLLVGRIVNQIESVENYQPGVTPVAFAGALSYNWKVNIAEGEFLEIQDWTGLYNSYSATYNMGSYLTRYLHYPIPLDRSRNYAELPEVQAMPMYPAPDSNSGILKFYIIILYANPLSTK